tara:strand:+ start:587 stop:853 length:267 start_codon:yes stop_codon:yes gene_type:complete
MLRERAALPREIQRCQALGSACQLEKVRRRRTVVLLERRNLLPETGDFLMERRDLLMQTRSLLREENSGVGYDATLLVIVPQYGACVV